MNTRISKVLIVIWIIGLLALPLCAVLGLFLPPLPIKTIFAIDNSWILLGSNIAVILIPVAALSAGIYLSVKNLNSIGKISLAILGSIILTVLIFYVNLIVSFLVSGYLDTILKPL